MKGNNKSFRFTNEDIEHIRTRQDLLKYLKLGGVDMARLDDILMYETELQSLQIQLLKLQNWVVKKKKRVVILFEGRDAAGKGGTIRRFTRFLNPRSIRVVALNKPTVVEKQQWYFRRHIRVLPNAGEIVFFDRSWYNRAVVEPVMGFCTKKEYRRFMLQVPEFEHMIHEEGIEIIKFWFSISQEEQNKRFHSRRDDPLKQWKLSPVDLKAQDLWDDFTKYKEEMFIQTHSSYAPWIIISSNVKRIARLEAIRYVLSRFEYNGKEESSIMIFPDDRIVRRFHRSLLNK